MTKPTDSTPSPIELMRDMDEHLAAIGIDPVRYPWSFGLTPSVEYRPRPVPSAVAARWGRSSC